MFRKICLALAAVMTAVIAPCQPLVGQYWIDSGEPKPFTPGLFEIDTSSLTAGLHTFNAYVQRNSDEVSPPVSTIFIRQPLVKSGQLYKAILTLDGTPYQNLEVAPARDIFNLNFDFNSLPVGLHSMGVQLISPENVMLPSRVGYFYRIPTSVQKNAMKAFYLVDGKLVGELQTSRSGDTYHIDVDFTSLSSGIHSITAYLSGPDGLMSDIRTSWFTKIPVGGEGVCAYEYWLNNDRNKLRRVELSERQSSLGIASMLDVDMEPFCSGRYAFALEDNRPVTYARNDFQISFYDADNRMTTVSGSYTDVRVRNEVEDIERLDTDNNQFFDAKLNSGILGENSIKWYSFEGEPGDSVSVRLDDGGMFEIYGPDGEKLIARSGADAIKTYGTRIYNKGTYYMAVHDPSSKNKSRLTGRICHIGRYSLICNTPTKAGATGILYMDITGNGFDDLKSLALVASDGTTIAAKEFAAHGKYDLTAVFDLSDETIPQLDYSLVAVFDDKNNGGTREVAISKALTVEEKQKSDISVSINPLGTNRNPYEIEFTVVNNSNRICYGVPFYIANQNPAYGYCISLKNFYVYNHNEFSAACPHIDTDDFLGSGKDGNMISCVIPYIGPYETQTYTIGLRVEQFDPMDFYSWVGKPWSEEFEEILASDFDLNEIINLEPSNVMSAKAICRLYHEFIEGTEDYSARTRSNRPSKARRLHNAANLAQNSANVATATGLAIGGMVNDMRMNNLNASLAACGYTTDDFDWAKDYENNLKNGMPTPELIVGTAFGNEDLGNAVDELAKLNSRNPTPAHQPRSLNPRTSWDPNEMHGYKDPSGSNFIGKGVKKLVYTVEFENDSTVANAPAMTINVVNKLDGKCLDLNSFIPLNMQISDKTVDLPAVHHFVITLDMRPETSVIAELKFDYDPATGMAEWQIRSLDPLTMDETEFWYNGILPVNDESGSGQGFLTYSIDLAEGIADNTEISNKAVIVFDNNDPIETPVWTNITDFTAPEVEIQSVSTDDNLTFEFEVISSDDGSGIWYYELYSRERGTESWTARKAMIEQDSFIFTADEPLLDNEFKIVAVDRAGNRSDDIQTDYVIGDADGNGVVNSLDNIIMTNYFLKVIQSINFKACDINKDGTINNLDVIGATNIYLNSKN